MKDRTRQFGESAGHKLLKKLQEATSENVRFHLMSHSFGCVVVSATLAGPNSHGALVHPVNSVSLLQDALFVWSYCSDIRVAPDARWSWANGSNSLLPPHWYRFFSKPNSI